jgi:hypothetical protein
MSQKSRSKSYVKYSGNAHRQKILSLVNNLNDQDLEKVSQILNSNEVDA